MRVGRRRDRRGPRSRVSAVRRTARATASSRPGMRRATAGPLVVDEAISPPFGKRAGVVRAGAVAARRQLVVETGVHDGLGSLLLLRALERNAGRLGGSCSFDINPARGMAGRGRAPAWELRIESTRTGSGGRALARRAGPVHPRLVAHLRARALRAVASRPAISSADGVLLTDNAHGTRALADVCAERGLRYDEFHERPRGHFYPAARSGRASLRAGEASPGDRARPPRRAGSARARGPPRAS